MWLPVDIVVIMLALGVILGSLWPVLRGDTDDHEEQILGKVYLAIIAIISLYVGSRLQ